MTGCFEFTWHTVCNLGLKIQSRYSCHHARIGVGVELEIMCTHLLVLKLDTCRLHVLTLKVKTTCTHFGAQTHD